MTAGRTVNAKSVDWCTPPKYVNAVRKALGGSIELDPCSNQWSIVDATTEYALPDRDGLVENWNFRTIFVNPPYGADRNRKTTIKHWLLKCAYAHKQYQSEVIALVPVAPNTSHWKKYVWGRACAACFLYDTRLKFLENNSGNGKGAPMACAMIYWGNHYEKFLDVFLHYGAVVDLRNLQGLSIGSQKSKRQQEMFLD